MSWADHLTEEEREILRQASKPYGSVDERYLRDWLLETLHSLAASRALVAAYRARLEAKRTQYMAAKTASNTVEIATLGWALIELALTEKEMMG